MRQRLTLAAGALLALATLTPSGAAADPPKPAPAPAPAKQKPIDVSKMKDKLDVYREDNGHYVVVPREASDDASDWVFYGDGKTMYQQRVFGSGSSDEGLDFTLWAPRVSQQSGAQLTLGPSGAGAAGSTPRKPTISCDPKVERALVQLPSDQAKAMLGRATFMPPLWQRITHLIARDDDGTYYFVDVFRDESGGGGHRLFVGKKSGQMKEQVLTNVVSDPAGEVFATKDGSLKTFGDNTDKAPVWRHADKATELTVLDVSDARTRLIIYKEFGIYGALGTPCD